MFEYNFGDSEVLMFILLVSALPYALRLERERAVLPAPTLADPGPPAPAPSLATA
jgi:hypothetical protein